MTRVCEWCGIPIDHDGVACSDSHRAKRWRWLNRLRNPEMAVEAPPPDSPLLFAERPRRTAVNGSTSGAQVSYCKALRVLMYRLAPYVENARIEEALREALPEKQRRRLEARR